MKPLNDNSPCPVNGKHFGKRMEAVPASFLDWIVGQPWVDAKYPEVVRYVEKNRKVIDMELEEQGLL